MRQRTTTKMFHCGGFVREVGPAVSRLHSTPRSTSRRLQCRYAQHQSTNHSDLVSSAAGGQTTCFL